MKYKSLVELFKDREKTSDRGITFINGENEESFLSYSDLYKKSLDLLFQLQENGIKKGNELVFQIKDNEEYLCSFWACILGGIIPIPVSVGNNDEHRVKLIKVWGILNNPYMLTDKDVLNALENLGEKEGYKEDVEKIKDKTVLLENLSFNNRIGEIYNASSEDIGFIQFSSGSTGDPKGVVLTHDNLLKNITAIEFNAEITLEDSMLSWMPLTHDMGLIGIHMTGVLVGLNQFIIPTNLFVRRPVLWMEKVHQHKASLLYSPNFGYKHFLSFLKQKEKNWDLSRVRLIFNGAEPISYKLCNEYLEEMAKYGMRKNAMYTVYGLAEASVAVSFPKPGAYIVPVNLNRDYLGNGEEIKECNEDDEENLSFVEVGSAIKYCQLRIADDNGKVLDDKKIGYIEIKGENVTKGYYNNEEATKKVMSEDGWLNTGDLGFLNKGQLTITGRAKDIIFVNGQNYYSHDIERVAEDIPEIELGKIAATSILNEENSKEEIIIFVHSKKKAVEFVDLAMEIKEHINKAMGLDISEIIPIKKMPKTTSGKIQRYKLKTQFILGEYDEIRDEMKNLLEEKFKSIEIIEAKTETEKKLVELFKEILETEYVGINNSFFSLGGNSLKLTLIMAKISEDFQVDVPINEMFLIANIEELGKYIEKSEKNEYKKIEKTNLKDYYPLAAAQKRIYIMSKLQKETVVYNIPVAYKIKGKLDIEKLESSFKTIIKRNGALRTAFETINGEVKQRVYENIDFKLEKILCASSDLEKTVDNFIRPFDISKPGLIRLALLEIKENEEAIILIDMHHIISDGISTSIILKEFSRLYSGEELEENIIDYKDYSVWANENKNLEKIEKEEKYWLKSFENENLILNMPTDYRRENIQTYEGSSISAKIGEKLTNKIKEFSNLNEMTPFMLLLTAYNIMLHKYTGQEEITVGTPVAGRSHKDIQKMVGMFVNTLALKNYITSDINVKSLLSDLKKNSLNALSNQSYQFENLVDKLKLKRDTSRNPLFDTMFTLQNMDTSGVKIDGCEVEFYDIKSKTSKVDFSLEVTEYTNDMTFKFEYSKKLYKEETIKAMSNYFENVLTDIIENPNKAIKDIEMISKEEKNTLLNKFNETKVEYKKDILIHTQFEEQVKLSPEKIALEFGNEKLTYKELNEKANQLARALRTKGVGKESIVAVLVERSLDMIIGILGVLKTGGAYLPLDPTYPQERIDYMLQDSGTKIVLSQNKFVKNLEKTIEKKNIINLMEKDYEKEEKENLDLINSSEDLIYLIYTSGSTGKPKGVMLQHYNVSNFIKAMKDEIDFKEDKSIISLTTISFDIFVLESFVPLTMGMRVIIGDEKDQISGDKLSETIKKYKVDMIQVTPSRLNLLTSAGKKMNVLNGLKDLIVGGEAFPENLFDKLKKQSGLKIYNVYGPTETTVWSTVKDLTNEEKITIGKPIANTQIYILDKDRKLKTKGLSGELWIGGAGVARGYFEREELTNERFINNPYIKGEKIYNTGDLARWQDDGDLEILGRSDSQVKIRGYRIEIGEIETIIKECEGIKDAAIVAKEDNTGFKYLSAYIVSSENDIDKKLRKYLNEKLPPYMVPSYFNLIDNMPQTPNGKTDRNSLLNLKESSKEFTELKVENTKAKNEIENLLIAIWKEVLSLEKIALNDNFFDIGGHSLKLIELHEKIAEKFDTSLTEVDLFQYTTIETQAKYLSFEKYGEEEEIQESQKRLIKENEEIAIVGLSCRVPGAKDDKEFWENLCAGKNSIKYFTDEELLEAGASEKDLENPNYVKAWGRLDEMEMFDAQFFGYTPREAEIIDPQQRVFLEQCYKGLEDAGYDSERYQGAIGVFAGIGMNTYVDIGSNRSDKLAENYQQMISNDKDFLATRVAYKMNLRGPAITVQTACSTSLVAVHMGCQSLRTGESDMIIAGGVSIRMPQDLGYIYQEGMILSPDGHCRAFDEKAKGTVSGNGAGVVILKRLSDAIKDRDRVYAVIKGSAINNDGAQKAGYTAPSIEGQSKAISEALNVAGVEAETVGYIEAHGTGTSLGDPIEIQSLNKAYGNKNIGNCAIGSVKTNIGHLDSAAGVSGLIKTVKSIYNRKLVPSINYEKPNPKIDFGNSNFYVNTEFKDWENGENPLRAGISSFGIGGTNVHIILEEALKEVETVEEEKSQLVILSAQTKEALEELSKNHLEFLKENKELSLNNMAFTMQEGRKELEYRKFYIANTLENAIEKLELNNKKEIVSSNFEGQSSEIAFMFPGQGTQYVNMGKKLYETYSEFKECIDYCSDKLSDILGEELKDIFYPESGKEIEAENRLKQTEITQPSLFVIEYAMAKLMISLGIKPNYMIGHSIGEYVAACIAGVFSLDDGLKLVAARGKLMQSLDTGSMLAVFLSESQTEKLIGEGLSIAVINSKTVTVVSGYDEKIAELKLELNKDGVMYKDVNTSHAFHSIMMDPILDEFREILSSIEMSSPKIEYLSNLTGTWIKAEEAVSVDYWVAHLRGTVRFVQGVVELMKKENITVVETGPGSGLARLMSQEADIKKKQIVISSLGTEKSKIDDNEVFLNTLGNLWLNGAKIEWKKLYNENSYKRVSLPTYPFKKMKLWKDKGISKNDIVVKESRKEIKDWFYAPSWKRSSFEKEKSLEKQTYLLFMDINDFSLKIREQLLSEGNEVISINSGWDFEKHDKTSYVIDGGDATHYTKMVKSLKEDGLLPQIIVHSFNLDEKEELEEKKMNSFYSLLYLAQAVKEIKSDLKIVVLSSKMQNVDGLEKIDPVKALISGPVKIIDQENTNILCRSIDINRTSKNEGKLVSRVIADIKSDNKDQFTAYKGAYRWTQDFENLKIENSVGKMEQKIKENGVYMITGGLGSLGLLFAEYLTKKATVNLILTTSREFPLKETWDERLLNQSEDSINQRIKKIKEIESLGAKVEVITADVTNELEMEKAVKTIISTYGKLDGLVHTAGVAGGGLIELKTKEVVEKVLKPKVDGTLILDKVLKDLDLDFFILFSSVTSILGGIGQIDYCSANAFLDSYAQSKTDEERLTLSINWDTWNDIGMAVDSMKPKLTAMELPHPLINGYLEEKSARKYLSNFSMKKWILNEHWILGNAIVPGTTYLELAKTAFESYAKDKWIEIKEVYFMAPLIVKDDEEVEVYTIIKESGKDYEFSIMSQSGGLKDNNWHEHAKGKIKAIDKKEETLMNVSELELRCNKKEIFNPEGEGYLGIIEQEEGQNLDEFVKFGSRWNNIGWVKVGEDEGIALLELPEDIQSDYKYFRMHPAILDSAVAFLRLFKYNGVYLPLSYEKLTIKGDIKGKIFSYVKLAEDGNKAENEKGILNFDVSIIDENGVEIIAIERFTMREIDMESLSMSSTSSFKVNMGTKSGSNALKDFQMENIKQGIKSNEGIEIFDYMINADMPQILVSTYDFNYKFSKYEEFRNVVEEEEVIEEEILELHPRPELKSEYVEAKSDEEKKLAKHWQKMLGIEKVGVQDDIFELGGHSLLLVQFHKDLKEMFETDISVVDLYKYTTISSLVKYIFKDNKDEKVEFKDVNDRVNKKKEALKAKKDKRSDQKRERRR